MTSIKTASKNLLATALFLITSSVVYAQPHKVLRIKNGADATKVIAARDRFQYPAFQPGTLHYMNGNTARGNLNYCYLLGEVMFINPQGDTLAIADNNMVGYVNIGNTKYYPIPENGYAEVVEDCGTIQLVRKVQYQLNGVERKGAYQNTSELGSSYSANTYTDINGRTTMLPSNNTVLLKPIVNYFFSDINRRFSKATKTNLLRIFSKKKKEIAPYLEEQDFDYANEEDLKKAIRYCSIL